MRHFNSGRLRALIAALVVASLSVSAVALAAGGATDSKAKVKVKCPRKVTAGKKVTCKVVGKLPKGPKGPKGAKGATGDTGNPGSPGVSGYEIVSETFKEVFVVNSGGQRGLSKFQVVNCPAGKKAIGGGGDLGTNEGQNGNERQMIISANIPTPSGDGWRVQVFNNSTSIDNIIDVQVYAICANVA